MLLLTIVWACYTTKEYHTEQLTIFSQTKLQEFGTTEGSFTHFYRTGTPCLIIGVIGVAVIAWQQLAQQLFILAFGIALFGVLQLIAGFMQKKQKTDNGFFHVMQDLLQMPFSLH